MASERGGHRATIEVPVDRIVAVMLDFEKYAAWQSHIVDCHVLERDDEGRGSLVETLIDAKVRKVRYVAQYSYNLPGGLSWRRVSGDLKDLSSRYTFRPTASGATEVSVDIDFDAGFYVPGPMKSLIRDQSLRTWMRELGRRTAMDLPAPGTS